MIFHGAAPLTILAIKRRLFCNFAKTFNAAILWDIVAGLKFSIDIDL